MNGLSQNAIARSPILLARMLVPLYISPDGTSSFPGLHGSPSVTEMRGEAFNGGAERQYPAGWSAVPIRNIGGVERA